MTQASAIDSDSVATVAAPSGLRRYSPLAMTLHWVMAALILFAVVHGLLLDAWPRDSKVASINIHAQSGLLVTQPRRCGTISSAATRCCCECCRVPGNSNQ